MHRLFTALSLPEVVQDAISQLQNGIEGVRWLPEDNLHLTLQFIGDADRHGLAEIHSALRDIGAPDFEFKLSGCGFFGDRKPHSLWVGVSPSPELIHLQAKVATALSRAGFPGEKRKFHPHITIGRTRNGVSRSDAAAFCAMHGLFSGGPIQAREFHLYESHLGKSGSHYEILASYPLSSSR